MATLNDQEFVETIVKALVEHPEDVKTERTVDDKGTLISLYVNETEMGKIIGKGGRTINSIRKLLHVLGAKSDERINLKLYEPGGQEVSTPSEDTGEIKPEVMPAAPEATEEVMPTKKDELADVPEDLLA